MHPAFNEYVSIFCLPNKKCNPGFLKHGKATSHVKGVTLAEITVSM